MEIVSIHEKTNRARRSSSETSLEFVKSIVPEPINKAIASSATSLEFVKSIVPKPIYRIITSSATSL